MGAARFLLTAKLSTADAKSPSSAESVAKLCSDGKDQGILIVPQASLASDIHKKDLSLQYGNSCKKDEAAKLYEAFAEALVTIGRELCQGARAKQPAVVPGDFLGRQVMEMSCSGPFMHSFKF